MQRLKYWLARYNLEGDFLGWQELSTQLSPCSMSDDDLINSMNFGALSKIDCEFDLTKLKSDLSHKLPLEANIFYELFVEDRNKKLIDVPVLIRNFRDVGNN